MSFVREPNAEPIPGYSLIEPLGSGGFGEAWKCLAPGGIEKAIKFVFGKINSPDVDGARADQELKALNRVKEVRHPFVLQMDLIKVVDHELVIVMELADKSLHDAYQECLSAGLVGIPRDTLLRYIRDAAEALDHMNEKHSLQHLDIKPRNLFLVSDRVKVADFGLVKHLERSGISGGLGGVTPLYAAPETFTGGLSDRSDQYSLAIVYQELLTGQRPFNGRSARQLAQQHMNEAPDVRALPEGERPVVQRALEKDPAKRFANCLAFVRALYSARSPSFARMLREAEGKGQGPKSMFDTLEHLQMFDQSQSESEEGLAPVDLGENVSALISDGQAVSNLGVTVAQPATGALRPTLVLGLGGYGRRALMELRCRLIDRFGDLDRIPMIRFLYIDTDAEAIKSAQKGTPELAFRSTEVYHLELRPVSHYRRRQIDQLNEWLPREKLYSVSRSLKTQGSRALARLAFTDNYQRLMTRLRRDIGLACDPDAVYQTVSQTGLALRDSIPRIYVLAGATGGASGYLADLGYATKRLLATMKQPESPVNCLLFCGAPEDPATPRPEQANLYATITEVNHFSDSSVSFSAQYGPDGPRLVDQGTAYDTMYLVPQPHRTPEARRDALAHMGSYLFHELTTPLGLKLDQTRIKRAGGPHFRSLGTFGVWFPRGLMLRLAARSAVLQMFEAWQADGPGYATERAAVEEVHSRIVNDPGLQHENLVARVAELAAQHMDGHPRESLTRMLMTVEDQAHMAQARDEPGTWARQASERVRNWLGGGVSLPGVNAVQVRRSPLTKALEAAAADLAVEWEKKMLEGLTELMGQPGRRIAIAEAALGRFLHYCNEAMAAHENRLLQQTGKTQQAEKNLEAAMETCLTGGAWSWFGIGKSRRLLRGFLDQLSAYARQCVAEDTSAAVLVFYGVLRGKLTDRLRELGFCRQRLRHMQEAVQSQSGMAAEPENVVDTLTFTRSRGLSVSPLTTTPFSSAESYWESIRASLTTRVVLPDGQTDLEHAAAQFLVTLGDEHWVALDQAFSDGVLADRGGLMRVCQDSADLMRHLVEPLLSEAINTLSTWLPVTDVAAIWRSVWLTIMHPPFRWPCGWRRRVQRRVR
jgi:eukaryotic-like serine/threonine-protein kinase